MFRIFHCMKVRRGPQVKQKEKRLSAFERWCYKLKIKWTEHITNEKVLKKVEETRSFLIILKTKKAKLIAHILLRYNNLFSGITDGVIEENIKEW